MVQRYDLDVDAMGGSMRAHDDGDYVEYADHLREIAARDAEITELRQQLADAGKMPQWKEQWAREHITQTGELQTPRKPTINE